MSSALLVLKRLLVLMWEKRYGLMVYLCLPVHDKYRGGHSQRTIELSTGFPVEDLEKGPKEFKGFAAP